jgi:hypothetical protein
MPFGDGKGPSGQGPGTGRGAGFCSGFAVPGSMNRGVGFFGRGRGAGRGWRNRHAAFGWRAGSPGQDDELGALKDLARFFERALDGIRKRIDGHDTKAKPE